MVADGQIATLAAANNPIFHVLVNWSCTDRQRWKLAGGGEFFELFSHTTMDKEEGKVG